MIDAPTHQVVYQMIGMQKFRPRDAGFNFQGKQDSIPVVVLSGESQINQEREKSEATPPPLHDPVPVPEILLGMDCRITLCTACTRSSKRPKIVLPRARSGTRRHRLPTVQCICCRIVHAKGT